MCGNAAGCLSEPKQNLGPFYGAYVTPWTLFTVPYASYNIFFTELVKWTLDFEMDSQEVFGDLEAKTLD